MRPVTWWAGLPERRRHRGDLERGVGSGDPLWRRRSRHSGAKPSGLCTRLAYDLKLMFRRYQQDGTMAEQAEIDRLTTVLGHAPRSYRDFAVAMVKQWAVT
ncbi:hypothetical protein [Acetobacter fallax]|uniref:Uncharacterized protein n=1 Tax=Acetobacter fallax TaxID=1737473 RepID=A0ABX0K9K8_9PROT|nr:hypothetical protein [Acetobacter fallax]NHO32645.1 hypothetical protein [Acetobacter fallax]NHO36157.1 hypothetical protein [Acetobacter fallax]